MQQETLHFQSVYQSYRKFLLCYHTSKKIWRCSAKSEVTQSTEIMNGDASKLFASYTYAHFTLLKD